MVIGLAIKVDAKEALAAIDTALEAMSVASLSDFLNKEAVPFMQRRAEQRFKEEGDDASGKWAPLVDTTERWRSYHGFDASNPINVRSGTLRDWVISNEGVQNNSAHLARVKWPGAADGITGLKYKTAQSGKGRPKTPARPVVAANETDMLALITGVAHWVAFKGGLKII